MTSLQSPYAHLDPASKRRLQCYVPEADASLLFDFYFPNRGAQDRILAQLFKIFFDLVTRTSQIKPLDYHITHVTATQSRINERLAARLLQRLANSASLTETNFVNV